MITVAIIEDHEGFREGLTHSLADQDGFQIHVAVSSLADYDARSSIDPDVVLMDLHLHEPGEPLRSLCDRGVPTLAMSAAATPNEMLAAIRDGARGYVSKDASTEELRRALEMVAAGHRYVSPTLAAVLLRRSSDSVVPNESPPLERRVLSLIAQGEHEDDVANELAQNLDQIGRAHV